MKTDDRKWQSLSLHEKIFYVLLILSYVALFAIFVLHETDTYEFSYVHYLTALTAIYISAIGLAWRRIRFFSIKKWYIDWLLKPLYEKISFVLFYLSFLAVIVVLILSATRFCVNANNLFGLFAGVCSLSVAGLSWEKSQSRSVLYILLGLLFLGTWLFL